MKTKIDESVTDVFIIHLVFHDPSRNIYSKITRRITKERAQKKEQSEKLTVNVIRKKQAAINTVSESCKNLVEKFRIVPY